MSDTFTIIVTAECCTDRFSEVIPQGTKELSSAIEERISSVLAELFRGGVELGHVIVQSHANMDEAFNP